MRVLIAGATGAMGQPLVRALVHRGDEVIGLTRSSSKRALLESLGARVAIGDALDADDMQRVVTDAAPTHIAHLLTALPAAGPMRARDLRPTNHLRERGTANLLRAAIDARVKRLVGESFIGIYGKADFDRPRGEDDPLAPPVDGPFHEADLAIRSMEDQLKRARDAKQIETVALRFGGIYGPEVASMQAMLQMLRRRRLFLPRAAGRSIMSFVHVDDAAAATIAALEHPAPGAVYNIVDDQPTSFAAFLEIAASTVGAPPPRTMPAWVFRLIAPLMAEAMSVRMPLSNAKAKRELGWKLAYPTVREGLESTINDSAPIGNQPATRNPQSAISKTA
jgi:nucleoside-diphosphate-sugar epimerase